jgi:polyhydroxyalkanoate synthase
MTARMSGGVSPASLRAALADWLIHLAAAPGKQLEVTALGAQNAQRIAEYLLRTALGWYAPPLAAGSAADSRFLAEPWQTEPYRFWQQTFLLTEQWWNAATRDVPGVTRHHEVVVSFIARQLLDMLAPTNFPLTNRSTARSNRKRNSMSRRLPARRRYGREAPASSFRAVY